MKDSFRIYNAAHYGEEWEKGNEPKPKTKPIPYEEDRDENPYAWE